MEKKKWSNKLLDRIVTAFQNPESRLSFQENERIYDQYLSNFIGGYQKNLNSIGFFSRLSENLLEYSREAAKILSQLKHQCFDLSVQLSKVSESINAISQSYKRYTTLTENCYKEFHIIPSQDVVETDKKLAQGISEWANQILSQKQYINDHMASFFHFKKHEFLTFERLIETKLKVDDMFKKKYTSLEQKKKLLFETKNVESWKIKPQTLNTNLNDLFKDYKRARAEMIPDVN